MPYWPTLAVVQLKWEGLFASHLLKQDCDGGVKLISVVSGLQNSQSKGRRRLWLLQASAWRRAWQLRKALKSSSYGVMISENLDDTVPASLAQLGVTARILAVSKLFALLLVSRHTSCLNSVPLPVLPHLAKVLPDNLSRSGVLKPYQAAGSCPCEPASTCSCA